MAAFRFKLDPVLRHRRMVEEQQQRELARLLRQRVIIEREMTAAQQAISEDKRSMTEQLVGHVDVDRIRRHAGHNGHIALHVRKLALKMFQLVRQIDDQRRDLLQATRARKAVELLRDRQREQWQRDQDRRENNEIDEITTQAYARRQAAGPERIGAA